jgi:hypothetical protein
LHWPDQETLQGHVNFCGIEKHGSSVLVGLEGDVAALLKPVHAQREMRRPSLAAGVQGHDVLTHMQRTEHGYP